MNQDRAIPVDTLAPVASAGDALGRRLAGRLDSSTALLSHEVAERLRAARARAVAVRKRAPFPEPRHAPTRTAGSEPLGWWARLASLMPALALALGLAVLHNFSDELRANEVAEVDSALLLDTLPPGAYTDAGFAQYLRLESDAAE